MAGRVDQGVGMIVPLELAGREVMAPERHASQPERQRELLGRGMAAGCGDRAEVEPDHPRAMGVGGHHLGADMPAFEIELEGCRLGALRGEGRGETRAGLRVRPVAQHTGIEGGIVIRAAVAYGGIAQEAAAVLLDHVDVRLPPVQRDVEFVHREPGDRQVDIHVAQIAEFTLPSLPLSNRAHPSSVFLPEIVVSSHFQ